jgi:DNA-binding NarL/FixJ family response regulator
MTAPDHRHLDGRLRLLDRRGEAGARCDGGHGEVRVLLADGTRLDQAGLRALLEAEADIAVVGEATSGSEIVSLARRMRPDVIVIQRSPAGLDRLSAVRLVLADPDLLDASVLILTARTDDVFDVLRSGGSGLLVDETDPSELVHAVRAVGKGVGQLSPSVARRVIERFTSMADPELPSPALFAGLTARERDVVRLVAEGLTNSEIAGQLVVSSATAKTHVSRAMVKLGVGHRARLVALAYQTGFVRPPRVTAGPSTEFLRETS